MIFGTWNTAPIPNAPGTAPSSIACPILGRSERRTSWSTRSCWPACSRTLPSALPFYFVADASVETACCSDPLDIEPGGDPAFTRCYGINTGDPEHDGSPCDACGWGVKYPPCPTFANSSTTIRWKCLLTTAKNVPGYEDAEGPPQSRNLTDMLVPVISSPVVLLVALEEVMRAW